MKFAVSDLLFPGFSKGALQGLSKEYGIEFFYEFGKDYYWQELIAAWGKRSLSIHGPCVAINLADPEAKQYEKIFLKTIAYAQKCGAEFVVVHTNEGYKDYSGNRKKLQALVTKRLAKIIELAEEYGVKIVIENVGLRTKDSVLFDLLEYVELLQQFPQAYALIDTGHAHVNGWDIPAVIKAVGPRLLGCHVHDNDGQGDAHLPVGCGTINWENYFAAVQRYAPQATQVFEYGSGFATTQELEQHIKQLKEKYNLK